MLVLFIDLDTPSLAANATFPVMENDYVYVQLTCTGGSSLSYSYTWFKNGQQIPSSSSSTILLNPITRNDVGTYICQTSNAAGKKNSSGVTVGVNCKYLSTLIHRKERFALVHIQTDPSRFLRVSTIVLPGVAKIQ